MSDRSEKTADLPLPSDAARRARLEGLYRRKSKLGHVDRQERAKLLAQVMAENLYQSGATRFDSPEEYWRVELGEKSKVKMIDDKEYGKFLLEFAEAEKLRAGEKELRPLIRSELTASGKRRVIAVLLDLERTVKKLTPAQIAECVEIIRREVAVGPAVPQSTGSNAGETEPQNVRKPAQIVAESAPEQSLAKGAEGQSAAATAAKVDKAQPITAGERTSSSASAAEMPVPAALSSPVIKAPPIPEVKAQAGRNRRWMCHRSRPCHQWSMRKG